MSLGTTIPRLKFVLLGDDGTGKKTLFEKFILGRNKSAATVSAKHNVIKQIKGIDVHLFNFPISVYPVQMLLSGVDVVFFLFDLTQIETYQNITHRWIPLFNSNVNIMKSHATFVILGTKADLKEKRSVTFKEASELTKLLGVPYMELPYSSDEEDEGEEDPFEKMVTLLQGLGITKTDDEIIYLSSHTEERVDESGCLC